MDASIRSHRNICGSVMTAARAIHSRPINIESAEAPQRLNLAQSFNALGVFFGHVVGGALFFDPTLASRLGGEQKAVQWTYLIAALLIAMFAVVLARATLPEVLATAGPADSALRPPNNARAPGAFLLSLATIGNLVGRFTSTAVLSRVAPRSLLMVYGVLNVLLCLLVTAGLQKVSAMALIAVFFFMSPMFATIFTLGVKNLGASTKRGASIMVMAIGGGVLLPYPMGRIADAYGTPAAFLLPAVCFAVVALYGWKGAAAFDSNSAHCARRSP
jgi:FHS family L-fucose permease-like MFS transporter